MGQWLGYLPGSRKERNTGKKGSEHQAGRKKTWFETLIAVGKDGTSYYEKGSGEIIAKNGLKETKIVALPIDFEHA
jgi:hypothetical protein